MRVLVFGAYGLLGPYLVNALSATASVVSVGRRSGEVQCDITCPSATKEIITSTVPDVVFNCAAWTNVDRCEADPKTAYLLNATAVGNIVHALPKSTKLVQISTDQVYPDTAGPHAEDETGPVNVYGSSKLAGEEAALQHANTSVLRVNFFGPSRTVGRKSLSDWVEESLMARQRISIFTDSLFSPLHVETLAAFICLVGKEDLKGVFNVGSREGLSKAAFALQVAKTMGIQTETAQEQRSTAIPDRAKRPSDLRMAITKFEEKCGLSMPTLQSEILKLRN